jgi:hypothetical protein
MSPGVADPVMSTTVASPASAFSKQMIETTGHGIALALVTWLPARYEPVCRLHNVALVIENNRE